VTGVTAVRKDPPTWEQFLAGTLLFVFICGMPFSWIFADPAARTGDGVTESSWVRLLWVPVYLLTGFLLGRRLKTVGAMVSGNPLVLALIGMTLFSAAWSLSPEDTLRRVFGLVGTTLFGLYLADRFPAFSLMRLLSMALIVAMGLSVLTGVLLPDYGTMPYDGGSAWRGVFSHKNSLGLAMLLAIVVFVCSSRWDRARRPFYWAATVAALGLLYQTRSFTPVLVAMIVLPVFSLLELNRRPSVFVRAAAVLAGLCVVIALLLLVMGLEGFFASAGKDFTLTGRTVIWTLVWSFIQDRFWLGYGYQSFWLKGTNSTAGSVWDHIEWEFQEAHNGYLEVWLGLGAVGMMLFILLLVRSFGSAFEQYRMSRLPDSSWPLTFLVLFLLINVTESHILIQNDVMWVLYVCTVLSVWKWRQSVVPIRKTVWRPLRSEAGSMASGH
jgi:exopolysaccharide production protein ExoQ